ncbi:MAG: hypothetical protein ABEJ98_00740 [Candidatus Nanohaloarchaea archaeon]
MGFIPDKIVPMNWKEEETDITVSEEMKGKPGHEVIDEVREKKTLDLD